MAARIRWIGVLVMGALLLTATPARAAEAGGVLTLNEAKALAVAEARSMQNLTVTQDKLKVDAKIAFDRYFGTDLQNNIDGYVVRLKQLQLQIDGLDPVMDAAEISTLRARMAQIEGIVSGLKTSLPATQNSSNMLRLQWRATSYAHEDMVRTISEAEKTLEVSVETMYFGLLNIQKAITLQNKNLDLLGMQLKIERIKRDLGIGTEVEEKSAALQYDALYKDLESLKKTQQLATWQLNNLLGRDANSVLPLQAEVIVPLPVQVDYEELLHKAWGNSLKIAQKEREIKDYAADARKEANSYERSSLLLSQEIGELALADIKEGIKISVKALVDGLDASYKTWENKTLENVRAEIDFQNNKNRYALGLISRLQYQIGELAYFKAANDVETAVQNWFIARHKVDLAREGIVLN